MVASVWATTGPPPFLQLREGDRHYALIDGAQMDRLNLRLSTTKRLLSHEPLFGSPLAPAHSDATPHLLAVTDAGAFRPLMDEWKGLFTSHGAVSWLVSPLAPSELGRRLSARLDARLPDRFDCVNRFFDGRVTPHLHDCLAPEQRAIFFSTCTQWWVVGFDYVWLNLRCTFAERDLFVPPLDLDDRQQAYLVDACYPYAVIEHFLQTDEDLLERVPASERYAFFREALLAAATFGIDGGASAVLFCTLTLTRGPRFYEEPAWRTDLEQVRHGETSLQQAVKAHHD